MKRSAAIALLALAACGSPVPTCTTDSECLEGQRCDRATSRCVAGGATDGSATGLDGSTGRPDASCAVPCSGKCCTASQSCDNGVCTDVVCDCTGRECGSDPCGNACGPACTSGKVCNPAGRCVTPPRDGGVPEPDGGPGPAAASASADTGGGPRDAGPAGSDAGRGDAGAVPCTASADCPLGQACNTATGTCGTACTSLLACRGGCCGADAKCKVAGPTACGSAACVDCSANDTGHVCVGGKCGCNTAKDCPVGRSCNPTTKACVTTCFPATQPCNGTCCANYVCQDLASGCGLTCQNCSVLGTNKACVAGHCGCNDFTDCAVGGVCDSTSKTCNLCNSNADCPVGTACNLSAIPHVCSASCPGGSCNGACCQSGTCVNVAGACGTTCSSCTAQASTPLCLNGKCGCLTSADCPARQACTNGTCGTACNPAGGVLCNGGCCSSGQCVAGTAATGCGSTGEACQSCAGVCCDLGLGAFCGTARSCGQ